MIYPVPKPERTPKRVKKPNGQRSKRTGGHLFDKLVSTGRRAFIKRQACVVTGAKTGGVVVAQAWMPATLRALCPYYAKVIPAHVKSRGSSGPDEANMIPLEWQLHELLGQWGEEKFRQRTRLMDLAELAVLFEQKYLARAAAIAKNMEVQ